MFSTTNYFSLLIIKWIIITNQRKIKGVGSPKLKEKKQNDDAI